MVLLNIALQSDLELYQLDVKTAFLNSPIEFDIWVELPADFYPDLLAQLQAATRGGGLLNRCQKYLAATGRATQGRNETLCETREVCVRFTTGSGRLVQNTQYQAHEI